MSEENAVQQPDTSTQTENSDTGTQQSEPMIPKSRLDAVIAERNEARSQFADLQKQLAKLESLSGDKSKLEAQLAEMQTSLAEQQTAMERKSLEGEVIAAAASMQFADPKDAIRMLNLSELQADGIGDALNALTESKPYLVRDSQPAKQAKISATNPAQRVPLTKESFKHMSNAEINALYEEGALNDLLGNK